MNKATESKHLGSSAEGEDTSGLLAVGAQQASDGRSRLVIPSHRRRFPKASWLTISFLTVLWVFFWGDFTWANLLGGCGIALFVTTIAPLPTHTRARRLVVRPVAFARLVLHFFWDVVVASLQISWAIICRRQPKGGIIQVTLKAHSDFFLAATAALTNLVPGSIVLNAHRLSGLMYVHVFEISDESSIEKAKTTIYRQEERLLRALATREELLDAGFMAGGSPKLGRVSPTSDNTVSQDAT